MNIFRKILVLTLGVGVCLLLSVRAEAQNFADWSSDPAAEETSPSPGQNVPVFSEGSLDGVTAEEILKMVELPAGAEILERTGGKYTLGPNDVIEISVMRHPEVTGEYPINKEGKIQYEFVGDIEITGLTKEEASDVIRESLSEYIVSPEVSVKIIGYNSKVVYVVGEVFRPGKIYMRGDTITVREALMKAGLPRLSGVTKKSRLIKQADNKRPKRKNINVYALLYEGDMRYNEIMSPGDILYIPPTFLTKVMRAISPVAAPIGQAAGARVGVSTLGSTEQNNY